VKIPALLLAIVIATLTITPCCALEGSESHAHETMQKETHECSEQNDDCCKDCSPFYVCGTCVGFTFTTQRAITFTIHVRSVKHNTVHIPIELPLIAFPIWQPPKLS